jgi:aspartyl-tRNA(Asn)/glutamyl-tRNA(Gln) amidotransferase subunit A
VSKEPCDFSVKDAASAMSSGKLTAVQLCTSCLNRIDLLENKIQAWVLVDREGAIASAKLLDQELKAGKRRGPLHGIPFGIKDMFYTAGLRTEAGSRSWSGFVPDYDATSVAKLKTAGAVILGKTQTTQFAYSDPAPTHNPWNIKHTPGGSSSGSAAGVAAGMCLAALGTQTLGSVLRPAAFNGIVGFKPHYGRVSAYGVVPLSWTLDHVGVLARSVEDVAMVFQSIAGYDPMDNHSLEEAVPDCLSGLEGAEAPRLGLLKQYFFDNAEEEMSGHMDKVAQLLIKAGANLKEMALPSSFSEIESNGRIIMSVECASYHQEMFTKSKGEYKIEISKVIEIGLHTSAVEYARRLEARLRQWADVKPLFNEIDAILTPGAVGAAPSNLNTTGNPVMQAPWTIMGLPGISLPVGLNRDGLPLAIQLVGRPKAEKELLAAARWCERVLNAHLRPPLAIS